MNPLSCKLVVLIIAIAFSLIGVGCETARDREEAALLNIDSAPHANLVKQAKKDWSWITGTTWRVDTIEGQKPIEGTELWIRFQDHTWMTGSAGCNRISAGYERRGIDGLKMSNIASTRMMCSKPAGTMQQESRFLHLLENIDAYHAERDTLTLSTNAITMLSFTRVTEQADDQEEDQAMDLQD
ncbi:MAG: META domain-containing protein [Phycisphaerales bacterium]|nr:META domain-containing protein [Phycisphaerales bacterium]